MKNIVDSLKKSRVGSFVETFCLVIYYIFINGFSLSKANKYVQEIYHNLINAKSLADVWKKDKNCIFLDFDKDSKETTHGYFIDWDVMKGYYISSENGKYKIDVNKYFDIEHNVPIEKFQYFAYDDKGMFCDIIDSGIMLERAFNFIKALKY